MDPVFARIALMTERTVRMSLRRVGAAGSWGEKPAEPRGWRGIFLQHRPDKMIHESSKIVLVTLGRQSTGDGIWMCAIQKE